ncbi:zinc finger MYM-type protein 1-like, partial [Aphis craccivora]
MNKSSQSNLSSWISAEPKSKKRKIDSLEIISSNNHEEVEGQCNKLDAVKSIVNTIIMMGRQEIPFRGTSDFGRLTVSDSEPTRIINDGNFRAILRMRVKSGDSELKNHIESAPCNALYTSPDIQNEFISICGNLILEKIVNRINKS